MSCLERIYVGGNDMSEQSKLILLTSGPIAVGKSSVVSILINQFRFKQISSSSHLKRLAASRGLKPDRQTLTEIGDALDVDTDFSWVVSPVTSNAINQYTSINRWVFDSVRKKKQVQSFRTTYPNAVKHIYFDADERILQTRYEQRMRRNPDKDNQDYKKAISTPNEIEARSLKTLADIVIDISNMTPVDAAHLTMEGLIG